MLFHWPKKSALDLIGQKNANGTIQATAHKTLPCSIPARTHEPIIEPMNNTMAKKPKPTKNPLKTWQFENRYFTIMKNLKYWEHYISFLEKYDSAFMHADDSIIGEA